MWTRTILGHAPDSSSRARDLVTGPRVGLSRAADRALRALHPEVTAAAPTAPRRRRRTRRRRALRPAAAADVAAGLGCAALVGGVVYRTAVAAPHRVGRRRRSHCGGPLPRRGAARGCPPRRPAPHRTGVSTLARAPAPPRGLTRVSRGPAGPGRQPGAGHGRGHSQPVRRGYGRQATRHGASRARRRGGAVPAGSCAGPVLDLRPCLAPPSRAPHMRAPHMRRSARRARRALAYKRAEVAARRRA